MNKKLIYTVLIIIVAIVGFVYIYNSQTNDGNTIKIGVISPITGSGSSYGAPIANAIVLAANKINATGGINGKKVELIIEDGECDAVDAVNSTNKLINQDKVKIIIGGGCTTESLAIAPIVNQEKILQIAAATSHNDYTNAGPFSFRVMPKADMLAGEIAEIAYAKGARKIVILNEIKDYPVGVVKVFSKRFEELGGEIVEHLEYQPEETDLRTYLTKFRELDADAIMFASQDDKGSRMFYKQLRELGMSNKFKFYFHDWTGLTKNVSAEYGDMIANKSFSVSAYVDPNSLKVIELKNAYKEEFGHVYETADLWVASSYDRLFLVKEAMESCKSEKDTECMSDYLTNNIKNWEGYMGKITFDKNGDIDTDMYMQSFDSNGKEVKTKI